MMFCRIWTIALVRMLSSKPFHSDVHGGVPPRHAGVRKPTLGCASWSFAGVLATSVRC